MERILRVSTADQVAIGLRQQIVNGELLPGTPLQELDLASSIGVSRNTLREALLILSLQGLVSRSANRGAAVAQLSVEDVDEIYRIRRLIEISAVRLEKQLSPTLANAMNGALDRYERGVRARRWAEAVEADFHFHTLLVQLHGSKRIELFFQTVVSELRLGMVLVDRTHDEPRRLILTHRELFRLLSSERHKSCATALAAHLTDSASRLRRVLEAKANNKAVPQQPWKIL